MSQESSPITQWFDNVEEVLGPTFIEAYGQLGSGVKGHEAMKALTSATIELIDSELAQLSLRVSKLSNLRDDTVSEADVQSEIAELRQSLKEMNQ